MLEPKMPDPHSGPPPAEHPTSVRPLLTVIVVGYNSESSIGNTIDHLERVIAHLDAEILVIDNASADATGEAASKVLRRGHVIRTEVNHGFGGGVNVGLRSARGEMVLILNDDVLPRPGAIDQMLEAARDQSVGLVGAKMVDGNENPSFSIRSHLPGFRDELARMSDRFTNRRSRVTYPTGDRPLSVGMLICACVMTRTDLLRELGGFNHAFFMYGEDIDLCRRLKSHGLRLLTVPSAVAVHQREIAPGRRYESRDFMTRILDARDIYYRIWLPRVERIAVHLVRAFGLSDQPFRLFYHLRKAFWDGPSLSHLRKPEAIEFEPPPTRTRKVKS